MKKYDPVSLIGAAVCVIAMVVTLIYTYRQQKALALEQQNQPVVISSESNPAPEVPQQPVEQSVQENVIANAETTTVQLKEDIHRPEVTLDVPGYMKVTLDGNGAGVQTVELEKYKIQTKNPEKKDDNVIMGRNAMPFLGLSIPGTKLFEVAEPEIGESALTTHRVNGTQTLSFDESWEIVNGGDEASKYTIKYTLKVTNRGSQSVALPQMLLSCGALPDFLSDEGNTSFSKYLSGCAAYGRVTKNDAKTLTLKDIGQKMDAKRQAEYLNTPANWVGVSSKYFLFAIRDSRIENTPAPFVGFTAKEPVEANLPGYFSASGVLPKNLGELQPGQSQEITVLGYAGPKSYQILEPMGQGISSILNMDLFFFGHFSWMGWLCKILLKALNSIAGWSNSYGLAIILITLVVKIVFIPLVWRSTRSMKKMSAIQPQLKALREKYKDDPQRMYYEQQKLFKENNVSQTGGCLPMLVQIPVFFAMFNTFRGAIEIRNTPFLWVADLSMPDPIFGLPIHPLAIMTGLTMLLQQRLQPMPDPNQAKMMTVMSLVFVVFFYNMPAGLTLYMTINQLTSIIQMLCFKKLEKKAA